MNMRNKASTKPNADEKKHSTEEAAALLRHAPQSLRAALCRQGHFLGMVPSKLPNGRLLWDAKQIASLINA